MDFERRKEKNIFNPITQNEEILTTEQSKNLYNITIKNENNINIIGKEINKLKCQIYDILNTINKQTIDNDYNNINKNGNNCNIDIKSLKDEIYDYINKEIKIQLKENIKSILNEYINNSEININLNENEINNRNKQLLNQKEYFSSTKYNNIINKNELNEQLINNNIHKNIPLTDSRNDITIHLTNNINEDDINERKNTIYQEDLTLL